MCTVGGLYSTRLAWRCPLAPQPPKDPYRTGSPPGSLPGRPAPCSSRCPGCLPRPSGEQRHPLQRCPLLRLLGRPLHRQLRSTPLHMRLQGN